jgi:hypothetical protein
MAERDSFTVLPFPDTSGIYAVPYSTIRGATPLALNFPFGTI